MKRPLIIGLLLAMVLALVGSAIVGGVSSVRTSEGSSSSVALTPTRPAPISGMFEKLTVT